MHSMRKLKILVKSTMEEIFKRLIFIFSALIFIPGYSIKARGYLLKFFFKECGKKFTLDSGVTILHQTNIDIGDNVYFAKNVWINGGGGISIGSNVLIGPMTIVSSGNHIIRNNILTEETERRPVIIGSNVWIGGNATLTAGSKVGNGVIVGAGSVVVGEIPDNCIVGGVPAKVIKYL